MRRFEMFLAVGVLVFLGMAGCCNCPDDGTGPPGPKTTIEPDGESFAWTDDTRPTVEGDPSGGEINSRFVNRKIDRLRACVSDVDCPVADDRDCSTAAFTRVDADGNEIAIELTVVECAGSNLCIEWHLTGYADSLTGRASGSRHLPEEFFAKDDDTSTSLTCDGTSVQYVEIDWKGGA